MLFGKLAVVCLAALGLSSICCMGIRPNRLPDPQEFQPQIPDDEADDEAGNDRRRPIGSGDTQADLSEKRTNR